MANCKCFAFLLLLHLVISQLVHGSTLCTQAPYPELCASFVAKTNSLDKNPLDVRETTLRFTLARAEEAHKFLSAMDLSSVEPRAKLAWADCLELYEDTVYHLNHSLASSHHKVNDVQTWLSAASTNHQTCLNGFIDFNLVSSHFQPFQSSFADFEKLLSNSLALNKAAVTNSLAEEKVNNRKLLSNEYFPEWLSRKDRKLLQSPSAASRADAVVAQDGSGNYRTISEAVAAAAKSGGGKRFVIHVKAGVYKENVEIKRTVKNVMLIGDGIGSTIITGSRNVQDGSTTFRSATFAVMGAGFIARGITFENTAGPAKHQAVAYRSGSDLSVLYGCSFKGYQDTLYVYSQRQFFRDCQIYGTQDFIFGNAAAVLQNCNIYVRKPMGGQTNTVTAQGRTDPNQNTGIVIHNSVITAASDFSGSARTFLGRPWQKYSRTVIMKTSIGGLIDSAGWLPWSGNFALNTLYYGEYMNTGRGAWTGGRVKWPGYHVITNPSEAGKFSVGSFLGGGSWIPGTGVPFTSGL